MGGGILPSARRYLDLFGVQLRMSVVTSMQYRFDFVLEGVMALVWVAVTLVPVTVVFNARESIAGWTYPEALLVMGWFTLMKAVLEGAVSPSLTAVVEHVRKGTLDFVLLKPVDAQFLVSTARFELWRVVDVLGAVLIFAYAFHQLGRLPSATGVVVALALIMVAVLVLYAFWILVVSASFFVVRVDNLSYLFGSIFDVARWPVGIFRGALRWVFTLVFPLALMTTYPAMALLGTLSAQTALLAMAGGLTFASGARWVWLRAIGRYTSASS